MKVSEKQKKVLKTTPRQIIAKATGYSESTVSMVWRGERANTDVAEASILMYQELAKIESKIINQLNK